MNRLSTSVARLSIVVLFLLSSNGCRTLNQFTDGLAVVTGQGGTIAREDVFDETVVLADQLNQDQPATQWETLVESEAADFIAFLDQERVLVGTVVSGSYLGVPKHGDIKLLNARTGEVIWSVARGESLKNGYYVLLTTEPLIVVVGRDDYSTRFTAYDPRSGSRQWTHRVNAPDQFAVSAGLDSIVSLSSDGQGRAVQAIDIRTGRIIWERRLPEASFADDLQDILIDTEDAVYIIGTQIHKISRKDGAPLWSRGYPVLQAKDRTVHYASQGLLGYSTDGMALIKTGDGSVQWHHTEKKSAIRFAAILDDRIFRVIAEKENQSKDPEDTIQAVNQKNGRVLWSRRIKETIVSPLYLHQGVLTFTTDNAIYGLMAKSGEQRFRNPFAEQFRLGGPASATALKRPDKMLVRDDKLYLVREMAGLRAYALPSGAKLWEQLNFDYRNRTYSADRLYAVLSRDLKTEAPQQGVTPSSSPVVRDNSQSLFIQSAQRRYEFEQQRTAAVLNNRNATKLERSLAHQSRATEAGLMAANQQVDMAMRQMQAAGDLFNAVVGLQGSIQKAIEAATIQGVISRKQLELKGLMGLQQACVQGRYYLWPFLHEGRGVTIVDLDSGKRNDLIFAPQMLPLAIFGIDLPTFRIGPDGRTLLMAGVGMDTKKYQDYVKWKYRMPKPSILAYDLAAFDFRKKSLTQEKAEQAAAKAEGEAKAVAAQVPVIMEKTKIHTAAQLGNLAQVKSLLDSGISANAPHPDDRSGPLLYAALGGKVDVVQLLIERGADVRQTNREGAGPIIMAVIGGHVDVVRLLIAKGADVNERTKNGRSALYSAKELKRREIVDLLVKAGAK